MSTVIRPAADWELAHTVSDLAMRPAPVEVLGGGSKAGFGRPVQSAALLSVRGLTGITLYQPNELVMSARAGTLVSDIEAQLALHGQMLAFEPLDLGPLLGGEAGQGTIGGVFATNLSGARRLSAGAARDHLLGVRAVTGLGHQVRYGGRVMKNVTGYDIARGLAGSWGTLAVLTELTFKIIPMPEASATLALFGLPDEIGVEVLCKAMGTPYEITGAAHLQQATVGRLWNAELRGQGQAATVIRIEGPELSLARRTEKLRETLKIYGEATVIDGAQSQAFWNEMRLVTVMHDSSRPLWRISTAPKVGPALVAAIGRYTAVEAVYDWSGGLIWLELPTSADAGATDIRRVIALYGGHATLVRAEPQVRSAVEVFQPLDPGVDRLTRRLKAAFDPAGILNPGRMYPSL